MKEFISPKELSSKVNLSYDQILRMCKLGEIETIKSAGGHFKIPNREIARLTKSEDSITREQYEKIIRENERLRIRLDQIKGFILEV